MKTAVVVILTVLLTLAALWVGLTFYAQSGSLNVAASEEPIAAVERFFATLSESSIREHARQAVEDGRITPPERVTEPMLATGAAHYGSMCAVCHGGPGVERGEIGQGLNPKPPELSHAAEELSAAEIYWVVENGIRHTGMPAYGGTHSEDELWALTSFVDRFDEMSPEEYRRRTAGASHEGHEHGSEGESRAEGADGAGEGGEGEAGHDHGDHEH